MAASPEEIDSRRQWVAEVFGSFRQERSDFDMFDHFVTPGYFPELTTVTPCILIGGRGTGKSTALWGLSYEGEYVRRGRGGDVLSSLSLVGIYDKADSAIARTFSGDSRAPEEWEKLFIHYVNLTLVAKMLDFARWVDLEQDAAVDFTDDHAHRIAVSLGLPSEGISGLDDLVRRIDDALVFLEIFVNSQGSLSGDYQLSVLERPLSRTIDVLASAIPDLSGKTFAFLIDEFESLDESQQQVFNTLVKKSSVEFTLKIAVHELGFKSRAIVGGEQALKSPDDYSVIDLNHRLRGSKYSRFAAEVVAARIGEYYLRAGFDKNSALEPGMLFPGLNANSEAVLLGAEEVAENVRADLAEERLESHERAFLEHASPLELAVLRYWSESSDRSVRLTLREASNDRRAWDRRLVNYGYATLFTLRTHGAYKIRKYYCGWDVMLLLSAGNVRFLLLLVSEALRISTTALGDEGLLPVSQVDQTRAASDVGKGHLQDIRGIDRVGGDLLRLALGLGGLLETMAREPHGHTPEVNEFYLAPSDLDALEVEEADRLNSLLRAAVQHSVLLRLDSSKRLDSITTREDDFQLHPVLSPYFVYSHRKKRKVLLKPTELLGLLSDPRDTLRSLLKRLGRESVPDPDRSEQLELFREYYEGVAP